ncbi:UbiX family flavin prenyltransferase [Thermoflavifilum thermophilum]|uniref:Flavin prenyltransferase UbiX n=1 Tax=Thermoflavifilum thermophilum TaxID=1393122 RepID=A0A1I7N2P6_9BACT|nr:UbiX family flavin prenyltransferase [Thermoflavifilum thermophilum]SFV28954.1 4-hydroxy-3-polyprenylbenzoate decarboxylase [Thermoflavifilum thermophilum]
MAGQVPLKLVVAVTGASGALYTRILLEKCMVLSAQLQQVDLVWSKNAFTVWQAELGNDDYRRFPFPVYDVQDFQAPFASGSARYDAMVICPCSMGTLGRIANGISGDLITRAADVMLKERRKLICVIRDMPYNLIHIENMKRVTEAGGIICPASPSFYSRPATIEQLAATVVDRVLDLLGLEHHTFRWGSQH